MLSLIRLTSAALLPFALFATACDSDLDIGNSGNSIQPDPGCVDAACGDECNICDPADAGCQETAVLKQCNSQLKCVAEVASCGGGTAGSGGGGNDGGCDYGGKHYDEGDSFDSTDGCNTCGCTETGDVVCTQMACADGCDYNGEHYEYGETFDSIDGCNTCSCSEDGVACTEMACVYDPCAGLSCGDECTICDPADPDCAETTVIKVCNESGICSATMPACD